MMTRRQQSIIGLVIKLDLYSVNNYVYVHCFVSHTPLYRLPHTIPHNAHKHHNMLRPILVILLSSCNWQRVLSSAIQGQIPLAPRHSQEVSGTSATGQHVVDGIIFAALETHADPVAALLSLHPELGTELAEERLLHIFGEEKPE